MPTYEYKCPQCGGEFEAVRKMTAKPGARCPECGGKAERQLSASSLVFKGSGFYITDYKRAGERKETAEGAGKPAGEKPAGEKPAAESPEKPKSPKKKKDH
jgi:putative FmdB family regulatory protein